jgi:hypothetical protein
VVALLCFANPARNPAAVPDNRSSQRRRLEHPTPVMAYRTDLELNRFNRGVNDNAILSFKVNNPCRSSEEGMNLVSTTLDTSFCRLEQLVGHTENMPPGWLNQFNRLHGSID